MNKSPKIIEVSVKELAEITGYTTQRIYQLVSEEHLPALTDSKLPLLESMTALIKFLKRDSEELKREKLLLTTANRKIKEGELDVTKGKFVERSVFRATMIAASKEYHSLVRQQVEKFAPADRRQKLIDLGVPDQTVQVFSMFDIAGSQAVIDRIERHCETIVKDTV